MSAPVHPPCDSGRAARARIVLATLLACAVAMLAQGAHAQGPPRPTPTPEPGTYEEWRDGQLTMEGIVAWPHDPANSAWWRAQNDRFWAGFDGAAVDHPTNYVFIRLGDGARDFPGYHDPYDAFEARWVAECMAAGDIVIPYVSAPVGQHSYERGPENGPRFLMVAVFAIGAPPDDLERVLRYHLQRQNLTSGEIETVVPTMVADRFTGRRQAIWNDNNLAPVGDHEAIVDVASSRWG